MNEQVKNSYEKIKMLCEKLDNADYSEFSNAATMEELDLWQKENGVVLPENYNFEAHKELVAMQPGDVPVTYADTSALERDFNYKPSTSLREGLRKFAEWYAEFYK